MKKSKLRIFDRRVPVSVLGPYQRAVVWVQGCPFSCPNCIVPESWSQDGGEEVLVSELVHWLLSNEYIEGVTFSGGEPMLQASAISQIITLLKSKRDIGIMCYTGFRFERLTTTGTKDQRTLLGLIDLLVDGTYEEKQHKDLLWRGSANQRILLLTNRYKSYMTDKIDRSAGLEFFVRESSQMGFSGVPNQPNFRQEFESRMLEHSVIVNPKPR